MAVKKPTKSKRIEKVEDELSGFEERLKQLEEQVDACVSLAHVVYYYYQALVGAGMPEPVAQFVAAKFQENMLDRAFS